MGCFDIAIERSTNHLKYRGLRLWTNRMDETVMSFFERFTKKKLDDFFRITDSFYDAIPVETYDYLFLNKYGISFHDVRGLIMSKNADLIHPLGYALARLTPEEMPIFMRSYRAIAEMSEEVLELTRRQLIDAIEAPTVNAFDAAMVLEKYGIDLPVGINKFAPDLSDWVHRIDGNPMQIKIKMTGCRANDDRLAIRMLEELYNIKIDPNTFKNTHVWHHLDDFDLKTGECTLQLISKNLHNDIIGKHIGSVRIWEEFFKIKYK
ncbi:HNH endonuclease [Maribacter flavus]|uniref:Uncharacterized protein n=1 Tax=Maribacter flavus TaxID=1658664 RepID=A0A5B2TSA3_9FLAO|nr:HNH endonuclease [Maribacter flavus]KAA2217194.1 hypothetical protein F0361_14625 [Maribacter flavus]